MIFRYLLSSYDRNMLPLMASIMVINVLAALDQTALTNMLPEIRRDFGDDGQMTWVISGYLMALTVFAPIFGKLGDIGGRRPYLVLSILIFLLASVACASASSLPQLVVFRIAQGIGAAGIYAIPNAILADEVPGRDRGKYQIFISAVWLVAALCGPTLGGMLLELASWRTLFWINLPLGAASIALVLHHVPARNPIITGRVDWHGAILLALTILSWMVFVTQLGDEPMSIRAWVIGVWAVVATLVLALLEARVSDPMLPPRLIKNREFAVGMLVCFASSAIQLGIIAYLPVYLQYRFSLEPVQAGLAMAPILVMSPVAVIISARILARTGRYRPLALSGCSVLLTTTLLLALLSPFAGVAGIIVLASGISLGASLIGPTLLIGLQNQVDKKDVGLATSMFVVFRNFGGTLGATFVGVMIVGSTRSVLLNAEAVIQGFVSASIGTAVASALALAGALSMKDVVIAKAERPSR